MLIEKYLHKAMLVIESALEWLRLHDTAHRTSGATSAVERAKAEAGFDPEWTADVIDLVEISMSMHERGAINRGKVPITAVVHLFFTLFGLKPGNFFSSYGVMRTHAGSRTRFHDELKEALENKMDRDDEKDARRKRGK